MPRARPRVERIDAIVLSGGSPSASTPLRARKPGCANAGAAFRSRARGCRDVPQAICFDLLNGGDKDSAYPPYRELTYAACGAAGRDLPLGTAGAGFGATTVNLKGGLGSASVSTHAPGHVVAALAVVNAIGSAVLGDGPHFWAAPWEQAEEFGGLGSPSRLTDGDRRLAWKGGPEFATTIALVATDAVLTKSQAKRLAIVAQGGLSKGLRLAHALFDGDIVFAAASGRRPLQDPDRDLVEIGALASDCLARAVARGVYEATALPFKGALPAWRDKFGRARKLER